MRAYKVWAVSINEWNQLAKRVASSAVNNGPLRCRRSCGRSSLDWWGRLAMTLDNVRVRKWRQLSAEKQRLKINVDSIVANEGKVGRWNNEYRISTKRETRIGTNSSQRTTDYVRRDIVNNNIEIKVKWQIMRWAESVLIQWVEFHTLRHAKGYGHTTTLAEQPGVKLGNIINSVFSHKYSILHYLNEYGSNIKLRSDLIIPKCGYEVDKFEFVRVVNIITHFHLYLNEVFP